MKKFKAIIFDLNGVLILDKPGYEASNLEKKTFKRLGLSLNDYEEKEKIKKELNWTETKFWDFVSDAWKGAVPNNDLIQLIKKIKRKDYKIALLSNTSGLIMRRELDDFFGVNINELFDEIIISSEVGYLKPNYEIYELCLRRLGVKANESIFIDDAKEYVEGGREVGMKCLLFKNNNKLKEYLNRLSVIGRN